MENNWPVLSYPNAKNTYETLHMFTQIVGKIKLATLPWVNHSWHVALYISIKGLTTSVIPYKDRSFQIEFDFIEHSVNVVTNTGEAKQIRLQGNSVASFYRQLFDALSKLEIEVKINPVPVEIENPIPFKEDTYHATYEPAHASALHKALLNVQNVLNDYRAGFKGKCSPIHFFWGSFDVAFSRFSGRTAPTHPGGIPNLPDWVAQEAYSHEVSSCGFWTGNEAIPYAAFYAYIYPEPEGYGTASVEPKQSFYHKDFREFILPYNAVQQSAEPSKVLLNFFNSTYNSSSTLAKWDRKALEI